MRRIRVAVCAAAVVIASTATFALTSRKSIALDINGETTTVTTYAMTVDRLLRDQGVDVKTHDQITTTSGSRLRNHDVVTVRSALSDHHHHRRPGGAVLDGGPPAPTSCSDSRGQ